MTSAPVYLGEFLGMSVWTTGAIPADEVLATNFTDVFRPKIREEPMNTAKPITADDARALMPAQAIADAIERLNGQVKAAAIQNRNSVRVDWLCKIEGDRVDLTPVGQAVKDAFTAAGFKFSGVYECRQFVDVGMKMTWEDEA